MIVKDSANSYEIAQVGVDPGNRTAGERFETRQHGGRAVGEIVEDDGCVAAARELHDDMRADIASAACDKNSFRHRP